MEVTVAEENITGLSLQLSQAEKATVIRKTPGTTYPVKHKISLENRRTFKLLVGDIITVHYMPRYVYVTPDNIAELTLMREEGKKVTFSYPDDDEDPDYQEVRPRLKAPVLQGYAHFE
jgi:hypothetical protein